MTTSSFCRLDCVVTSQSKGKLKGDIDGPMKGVVEGHVKW